MQRARLLTRSGNEDCTEGGYNLGLMLATSEGL
jgi:hypothetical protein